MQAAVGAAAIMGCDDGTVGRGQRADCNGRAVVVALVLATLSGGGNGDRNAKNHNASGDEPHIHFGIPFGW